MIVLTLSLVVTPTGMSSVAAHEQALGLEQQQSGATDPPVNRTGECLNCVENSRKCRACCKAS